MIYQGDCLDILPTLDAESVQCCVTSPPYWGLRDYGTATWEGGASDCDHKYSVSSPYNAGFNERWGNAPGDKKQESERHEVSYREVCAKCGARRIDSQLGLEPAPEEYVSRMVKVFREVWRVLKPDGTLWVNMGDSYNSPNTHSGPADKVDWGIQRVLDHKANAKRTAKTLKPKDLCGIPWRLAFALQADGWYLRSDIIWAKPNPMPESVTDRPTKAHEYIFLLTKRERYFYDADAIREPATCTPRPETSRSIPAGEVIAHHNRRGSGGHVGGNLEFNNPQNGRNKRTVWTVATQPYAEAHFATFPEDLIKPCILAGSLVGDIVLNPFAGSGTTGKVAIELGRKAVLIELNPKYVEMVRNRTQTTMGML